MTVTEMMIEPTPQILLALLETGALEDEFHRLRVGLDPVDL